MSMELDDRPQWQRLLGQATMAREMPEPSRRYAVKGLVHGRYKTGPNFIGPPDVFSDRDLVAAAYGTSDRDYWEAWLFGARSHAELADLLAAHVAVDEIGFARIKADLILALDQAPAGQSYRQNVEWLIANPNTRQRVPDTLQQHLAVTLVDRI